MSVTMSFRRAVALACTCLLAACGGGGGAGIGAGTDAATASALQPVAASAAPASATPATPQGTRPDVATATLDEIAAWNAQCITARCMIVLPERSGRSLNWWGTDPRALEQVNASCSPQPGCRIPDGDLLVWNFQCSPQPGCRVALSRPD